MVCRVVHLIISRNLQSTSKWPSAIIPSIFKKGTRSVPLSSEPRAWTWTKINLRPVQLMKIPVGCVDPILTSSSSPLLGLLGIWFAKGIFLASIYFILSSVAFLVTRVYESMQHFWYPWISRYSILVYYQQSQKYSLTRYESVFQNMDDWRCLIASMYYYLIHDFCAVFDYN